MTFVARALALSIVVVAPGCATPQNSLRTRAAYDLNCSERSIRSHSLGGGSWAVEGCGKRASYVLTGVPPHRKWVLNNVSEAWGFESEPGSHDREVVAPPIVPRQGSGPVEAGSTTEPSPAAPAWTTSLHSTRDAENRVVWTAQLSPPGAELAMVVQGVPAQAAHSVMLAIVRAGLPELTACEVKIVADGSLLPLPDSKHDQVGTREQRSLRLPLESLATIAGSQRTIAQACNRRVELADAELKVLRDFLLRFREELALAGSP